MSYSCRASKASNSSETWVSTDCQSIAKFAKEEGCNVMPRPSELCTDHSKSDDALVHFAKHVDFYTVFQQATSFYLSLRHKQRY